MRDRFKNSLYSFGGYSGLVFPRNRRFINFADQTVPVNLVSKKIFNKAGNWKRRLIRKEILDSVDAV